MSDEEIDSFASTLTDSPDDVPMLDFPVLTDAVEPTRRPRAETAYAKPPAPRPPAPEAAKPAAPLPRVVAAATAPAAAPAITPPQPAPKPAPPAQPAFSEDADLLRQTATMRAISVAKSIDDISNSMAETLFGDNELQELSNALAASGWTDDEAPAAAPSAAPAAVAPAAPAAAPSAPSPASTPPGAARLPPQAPAAKPAPQMPPPRPAQQMPAAKPAAPAPAPKIAPPVAPAPPPPPADDDPFDFLGLGRDAPLELIEDPIEPQQRKEVGNNR